MADDLAAPDSRFPRSGRKKSGARPQTLETPCRSALRPARFAGHRATPRPRQKSTSGHCVRQDPAGAVTPAARRRGRNAATEPGRQRETKQPDEGALGHVKDWRQPLHVCNEATWSSATARTLALRNTLASIDGQIASRVVTKPGVPLASRFTWPRRVQSTHRAIFPSASSQPPPGQQPVLAQRAHGRP